jgi:hypothetical protein
VDERKPESATRLLEADGPGGVRKEARASKRRRDGGEESAGLKPEGRERARHALGVVLVENVKDLVLDEGELVLRILRSIVVERFEDAYHAGRRDAASLG